MCCHYRAAPVLWLLGYPAQAVASSQAAVTLAQQLSHPYSLTQALYWAAVLHHLRREAPLTQARAEAAMTIGTDRGFAGPSVAQAQPLRGWALAACGYVEEGLAQLQQALDLSGGRGTIRDRAYHLSLLVEVLAQVGQAATGLEALAEALATLPTSGACWWEAELHRLRGTLLLRHDVAQPEEADACFQQALTVARRQQAKSLELRAAMSRSRLWQQQGKRQEAYALLAPMYQWFTEGFDTADLQEAKALLEAVVFQKWRWTEIIVTLGLIFVASLRKEWPMTFIAVRCPHCHSDQIVKRGKTARGTQRYLCQNTLCTKGSFLLDYCNRGCLPEVKQTIIDMSLNASGVRDTARSLHICPNTVLRELKKKEAVLEAVNTAVLRTLNPAEVAWDLERAGEAEAEMDEMWSFVGHKGNPRWLWHAIDHHTGKVLAYVFGRRKDEVFLQLKALLEPFGLTRYYTDYWGAYTRHLDPDAHSPGKRNTQKIERKHLTLRTRIKRLVRKTICFSKTTQMHDIVIGLFVNRYAFGRAV